MIEKDEQMRHRIEVYNDLLFGFSSCLSEDEMYWFIWTKIANIVKGVDFHEYQGDILGACMTAYRWNHNLPYWCWDFIDLHDEDKPNFSARQVYRELVAELKELGNYDSLGTVWQRVMKENDKNTILKLADILESVAYEFIPNTLNYMTNCWSKNKDLKPEFFIKMKKIATTEKRRTLKLSRVLRASVNSKSNALQ